MISGTVTALSSEGHGIMRHEGMVVFIPFTAPGDRINCRIVQQKKNFCIATLVSIEETSVHRTIPSCPYFGRCGGCQEQHLDYTTQLNSKQQLVADAFKRIGNLKVDVLPVVPATLQWQYRRHVTLSMHAQEGSFAVGYIETDQTTLLPVTQCPIFIDPNDPLINQVRELTQHLKSNPEEKGRVSLFKAETDLYVIYFLLPRIPTERAPFEEALKIYPKWAGIVLSDGREVVELGNTALTCAVNGLEFSYSPRSFIQNHPEQSLNIYTYVCGLVTTSSAKMVLDLYCGIGISSLLLARQGCDVVGVEVSEVAVQLAQHNARKNGIKGINFKRADVGSVLPNLLKQQPDIVVINPPRIGVEARVLDALVKNPPKEIIYISCMPSTLARDVRALCEKGYQVKSCQPFDMFPQTAHVETVLHLSC